MSSIIRPRLNDYHNIPFTQEEVDFAIPFLDEDIPLYLDPFLLWKSPSQQDNALHTLITNSFNYLGSLVNKGNEKEAVDILINSSECNEVGLGNSKTKEGKRIGEKLASSMLNTFKVIPQIPVTSAKRKLSTIVKLPTGKTDNADKKYEDNVCQLMASLLYPHLDFAKEQSRTDSNVLIRDLIFYNNRSFDFLDLLDEESLPSNSDCILIIGQFNSSMKQFRSKYREWTGIEWIWTTK